MDSQLPHGFNCDKIITVDLVFVYWSQTNIEIYIMFSIQSHIIIDKTHRYDFNYYEQKFTKNWLQGKKTGFLLYYHHVFIRKLISYNWHEKFQTQIVQ